MLEQAAVEDLDFKGRDIADASLMGLALDVARLQSYSTNGAYQELESLALGLAQRFPDSAVVYQRQVEALTALGQWRDFVARSQERLQRNPIDLDARRALAHWALRSPDPETAAEHFSVLQQNGALEAGDAATWIFAQATDEGLPVEKSWEILKVTESEGQHDSLWLRAKAMLLARQGRVVQARETLIEAIEVQGADSLTVEDGYLLGRIAEGAGLERVAHDLYSSILVNPELRDRSPLVYVLTKNALDRLGNLG